MTNIDQALENLKDSFKLLADKNTTERQDFEHSLKTIHSCVWTVMTVGDDLWEHAMRNIEIEMRDRGVKPFPRQLAEHRKPKSTY